MNESGSYKIRLVLCSIVLLMVGCVDQDTFGLMRRQLPRGFYLENRESSYYYLEYRTDASVLVSELGWNDQYFVGKIDHRNDSDNSPKRGKDWAVVDITNRTVKYINDIAYRSDTLYPQFR